MRRGWEQALGAVLMALVLLDVFLTVLYARMHSGIISPRVARATWWIFRRVAQPFGGRRAAILTLCGPTILVLLVAVWMALLTVGAALIIHPALGTAVRAGDGPTPSDFTTALIAAGGSLSVVASGGYEPHASGFRMLYLFNSFVGLSVTTLTLTYLMQVYAALLRRNSLGLQVHLLAAETDDAAELVAGLGPEGRFDGGYANLSELAGDVTSVKESHHFYPVLFYFRFQPPYYAVSQFTLVTLDAVTLIKSALDDERYAWLKESGSVTQLWRASIILAASLDRHFLPGHAGPRRAPDPQEGERWRRRYFAALRRLRQAGIPTIADEQAGAEAYVSLRAEWDRLITTLAPAMAYAMDEIDPAGSYPEVTDRRPEFRARLRWV